MRSPKEIIMALKSLGFTQRDISKHTQVPAPTINKILKGITQNPRWQTVEALQSFLDTTTQFDDENI